jgi:hypothetical protein
VQDVMHIPELWTVYRGSMDGFWEVMVREVSDARVTESYSAGYKWKGEHKGKGC